MKNIIASLLFAFCCIQACQPSYDDKKERQSKTIENDTVENTYKKGSPNESKVIETEKEKADKQREVEYELLQGN